jgi:glycosyltransferase involved in cell wall biosynthesis
MSNSSDLELSVVMPVHNALPYLDEAVQSILNQTRSDFEFVIYDDASTDGSTERLEEWSRRDPRIRLFRGEQNLGPAVSSSHVVRLASSPLIARMDADDISLPDRLEVEVDILGRNSDVGIVASLCEVINSHGFQIRGPEIWRLTRKSWFTPFPHGSMMFRRQLFDSIGGYRDECEFWEDLDFAIRASQKARIVVLPRPLYLYRQSTSSTRIASNQYRVENALDLRYRAIEMAREDRPYDELLRSGRRTSTERVDPRVFVSLGLLSLWSDQRPSFVRRFLRRARLRFDAATMMAIVWLSWARVSPRTVRIVMNLLSRARNAAIDPKPQPDELIEWRPDGRVVDLATDAAPDERSPTQRHVGGDRASPEVPQLRQDAQESAKR